jgi:hypothetical protein
MDQQSVKLNEDIAFYEEQMEHDMEGVEVFLIKTFSVIF